MEAATRSQAPACPLSWVGTWAASPQLVWEEGFSFPSNIPRDLQDRTIRQFVSVSLGGARLRVHFSNEHSVEPLTIGAVTVALAAEGCALQAGTLRQLTFGGAHGLVVPAGAPAVSDTVALDVPDGARLAVSLHLPKRTRLTSFHWEGRQTAYLGSGDLTADEVIVADDTTDARLFLSAVQVQTPNRGAVVVLGDSITDGQGVSVDADCRWPHELARRLAPRRIAVLNAGISGARLLADKMGVNAPARFVRDVVAPPGVKSVIVLLGINDIGWPGTPLTQDRDPPAWTALLSAYQQLIGLAHAYGLRVVGGTLPPFEGALAATPLAAYYSRAKDQLRRKVNHWIREGGAFDAVIDFDARLRDPRHPLRLATPFDCGDHLHPGEQGCRAMAEAVDLDALLG